MILSHRWVVGTYGPELSFVVLARHNSDDAPVSFGWVLRRNVVIFAKETDLIAYMEISAVTNRGGHMRLILTDGEIPEIECTPVGQPAVISCNYGVCCVDRLCTFTWGELKGICEFGTTSNFQRHDQTPRNFKDAIMENELHLRSGEKKLINGRKYHGSIMEVLCRI